MAAAEKDLQSGNRINWRSIDWIVEARDNSSCTLVPIDPLQKQLIGPVKVALSITDTKSMSPVPTEAELRLPSGDTPKDWDANSLRLKLLTILRNPTWAKKDQILWSTAVKLENLDRQLVPLAFALKQSTPRLLIADDVGLGKTSEAAIIISELLARKEAKRILVVCPAHLVSKKWIPELNQRFGLNFQSVDSDSASQVYASLHLNANDNPYTYLDRVVLSLDWGKMPFVKNRLKEAKWDLVIFDECHRIANRARSDASTALTHRFAKDLAENSKGLILMSATPHDGDTESFKSLIDLLKIPGQLPPRAVPKPVLIRRLRRDISDESRRLAPAPEFINYDLPANWLKAADHVDDLIVEVAGTRGKKAPVELLRIVLLKRFLSSPQALKETLNLGGVPASESDDESESHQLGFLATFVEENSKASAVKGLERTVESLLAEDSKLGILKDYLNTIPKSKNVLVFTEFAATARYLADHFAKSKGKGQRKVLVATGDDPKGLEQSVRTFNRSNGHVLFATDALSEGVDLQANCHHLIHYDLPFRPYRIEQRNGRIDRMGQRERPIIRMMAPRADQLELFAKKAAKSSQILNSTLSINRLYRLLNQQALSLGGSMVPVLEAIPDLQERNEQDLLQKLPKALKEIETFSPEMADPEYAAKNLPNQKDYELCLLPNLSEMTWSGQLELGLLPDLLNKAAHRVYKTLAEYWNSTSTVNNIEIDNDGHIEGESFKAIYQQLYPGTSEGDAPSSFDLPAKEDCAYEENMEALTWAHKIWDEVYQAAELNLHEAGRVNVGLSGQSSSEPEILVVTELHGNYQPRLLRKSENWRPIPDENLIEVLKSEFDALMKGTNSYGNPSRKHRNWAEEAYASAKKKFNEAETLVCMIIREPKV